MDCVELVSSYLALQSCTTLQYAMQCEGQGVAMLVAEIAQIYPSIEEIHVTVNSHLDFFLAEFWC